MQELELIDVSFTPETVLLELAPLQRLQTLRFYPSRHFTVCSSTLAAALAELCAGSGLPSLQRVDIQASSDGDEAFTQAWTSACGVARAMLAIRGRERVTVSMELY